MNLHRTLRKTRHTVLAVIALLSTLLPTGSTVRLVQAQSSLDLAYVRGGDIYLAAIANDQVLSDQALTSSGSNNNPAWSPDGRYLLYQHNAGSVPELRILDVLTGDTPRVIQGACCGTWNPYSGDIAYVDLNSGALVTADAFGSSQSILWPNVYERGTPYGRTAWAGDTIYITLANGDFVTQVWGVDGSGSLKQVFGPGIEGGMLSPSDALSSPAASLSGDLAVTVDTGVLGMAPGGPVVYAGYGGNGPAFGRWQVEAGIGDQPSWAPEGGRFAWEQWIGCNEAGIDAPGLCKGGIGIFDLNAYSQTMVLTGADLSQPAWRPAVPAPMPTNTPTRLPPTSTPVPPASTPQPAATEPPADAPLCGVLETVNIYSGMTAYPQAVLVSCGTGQLIEVGPLGGWGDGKLYRYSLPSLEPVETYNSELGPVIGRMLSSASSEEISSCQVCGLPDPVVNRPNSLSVGFIGWQPQTPRAMEEVSLALKMQGKGSTIATAPYLVDLTFGTDFPYDYIHYTFDSEDPVSGAHLSPRPAQNGAYDLTISGLHFPMTYAGSLTAAVRLKGSDEISSSSANFNVDVSDKAWSTCTGALAKGLNLLAEVPLPQAAQVETTNLYLEHLERLEICGDNPTCQAEAQASFEQATFKSAANLGGEYLQNYAFISDLLSKMPGLRLAARVKKVVDLGLDPIKCGHVIADFLKQALHSANQESGARMVNGFLTASPVYPLVTTADGLQTGFLPDGSLVEQIPDAAAVQLGEERLVLVPADLSSSLAVSGYASGTMDLYAYLSGDGGRSLNLTYQDVPVENGAHMELNDVPVGGNIPSSAYRSGMTLAVTINGKTEERAPDQIEQIDQDGQTELVDQRSPGGSSQTIMLVLAVVFGAALASAIILLVIRPRRRPSGK